VTGGWVSTGGLYVGLDVVDLNIGQPAGCIADSSSNVYAIIG